MVFLSSLSCMNTNLSFMQTQKTQVPPIKLRPQTRTRISLPPPPISKTFQDASFSTYLDGGGGPLVPKLGSPNTQRLRSSISTISTTPHDDHALKQTYDSEIDVFDAKKYFNQGLDHMPKAATKKDDPLQMFAIKEHSRLATPSIRSESSWNSQSVLLNNIPRSKKRVKRNKKSVLASIGWNCPCNDKNSVDVDDQSKQVDKTSGHHLVTRKPQPDYNIGNITFPGFNSRPENHRRQTEKERKTLEVFGSPILENEMKDIFTWDASATEEIKVPSLSREMDSDCDSDTSSDLFEIKSFSKGEDFFSRQALDGLSGCITPTTTCNTPNEESIECSVVTAGAANNFSKDLKSSTSTGTLNPKKLGLTSGNGSSKDVHLQGSCILSGFTSQKAVRVAGDGRRANETRFTDSRRRLESFRINDESKLAGFDARKRRQAMDAHVLPQSHHGNAAHLLYSN